MMRDKFGLLGACGCELSFLKMSLRITVPQHQQHQPFISKWIMKTVDEKIGNNDVEISG